MNTMAPAMPGRYKVLESSFGLLWVLPSGSDPASKLTCPLSEYHRMCCRVKTLPSVPTEGFVYPLAKSMMVLLAEFAGRLPLLVTYPLCLY